MLETATGTTFWVADRGVGSVAWDPSGRYVAWLDVDDEPTLMVMLVDPNNWLTVELGDIGAPAPLAGSSELVVLLPRENQ